MFASFPEFVGQVEADSAQSYLATKEFWRKTYFFPFYSWTLILTEVKSISCKLLIPFSGVHEIEKISEFWQLA